MITKPHEAAASFITKIRGNQESGQFSIYWKNKSFDHRTISTILVTFVMNWFGTRNESSDFSWLPTGFYMGGQGILFIYLLIIWFYNPEDASIDAKYSVDDNE